MIKERKDVMKQIKTIRDNKNSEQSDSIINIHRLWIDLIFIIRL